MGNCLRRDSATVWAGDDDDWVDISSQLQVQPCDDCNNSNNNKKKKAYNHLVEKQRLLGEIISSASTSSTSTNGDQVKIKITKKELDKLVHGGNLQGLSSVEQLLDHLLTMNGPDDDQNFYEMDHQRPWRPVLQTIPEY
ncbi:PREDICTED: DUF4228 domain [Prunus dulcis]|uniref:PREDICTED: DUF4228 domain n=1 Tax=Prunus dulcis TaxID=3755 RepID=A0A5E4F2E2_PRUDU|nr:uncharacterized protein LOC117624140 [Prunus dulcis]KAI5330903.1 hypothetical protein L3X38_021029 [Prunus dulcis]VVA21610.1 PREDICTED: DUF4228 domain [Prunus dulcis]